jgi:hypothetical protein
VHRKAEEGVDAEHWGSPLLEELGGE